MNEAATDRVAAYIARMRGQVLLRLRVAHPCGEFESSPGDDMVCPAILAVRGRLGFWLAGEYERWHYFDIVDARDNGDEIVIVGRSGPTTKFEITLSPIWMPEQWAAVAATEKYRPAAWAIEQLRQAIDADAEQAAVTGLLRCELCGAVLTPATARAHGKQTATTAARRATSRGAAPVPPGPCRPRRRRTSCSTGSTRRRSAPRAGR